MEKKNKKYLVSKVEDGLIIDLVLNNGKTQFCVTQEGCSELLDSVVIQGEEFFPVPASNNLLKHRALLLPSERGDCEDVLSLATKLESHISQYLHIDSDALKTSVCYVLLTWLYENFEAVPYLRFLGDLGTGKSRALKVLGSIVNKGFFASAASTISPIYYTLDLFKPTLMLDEADLRYSDASNEIVKIFNNGTVKGMPVLRQTMGSNKMDFEPRAFDVFAPKIIAMRRRFEDDGLESRFLTEEMRSRQRSFPINLSDSQESEALALRNMLLDFRHKNLSTTKIDEELILKSHSGRFNQMLLPLLSIAPNDVYRGSIIRFAERSENSLALIRSTSIESLVRQAYQELSSRHKIISISSIAEFVKEKIDDNDRPITNKLIGSILRLNLGVKTWKSNGVYVCAGLSSEDRLTEELSRLVDF